MIFEIDFMNFGIQSTNKSLRVKNKPLWKSYSTNFMNLKPKQEK